MHNLATRAPSRTQSPAGRTFEASTRDVARHANRPERDVTTVGIDAARLARALGWFSLSLGIAGTCISMVRDSSESGRPVAGPGRRDEGGAGNEDMRRLVVRIA